ncbi:MAG: tRNA (adenosine(37)-N6)-threonylcarbamoyltransferase complex dimerization subunit type 1 TsaB [Mariprofundus sp.]
MPLISTKSTHNILALDTATHETCGCLLAGGQIYTATLGNDQRIRSTGILPLLTELLKQADMAWEELTMLAFSHGPGSFTGLRIAAATLAGINSGLRLPVLHTSSLAVTAAQAGDLNAPLWVLEDARAGEVFAGCYRDGNAALPDCCMSWEQALQSLEPSDYVCCSTPPVELTGWQQLPLMIARAQALAIQVQRMATDHPEPLPVYPAPAYMQLSQAERSARVS